MAAALWRSFARRKPLPNSSQPTNTGVGESLARVLTTWDLTALGVGSTLGVGVYVLAGDVARRQAGPAVLLSFLVAGIASGLAGLCYSEFGARVPLAGSAYVYSYVSVGELLAFVIGWSLVLEYAIGSASVARALTSYVDQLTGNMLERTFQNLLPMNVSILAGYADPVSFAVAFGLSVILAFGVRESLSLNNVFAGLNMAVITFVVVAGCFKADFKNWNISPRNVPSNAHVGDGGFMPFGISGVLRGAATCFYGFVGFDCIAASGEEVRRPQRAIPIAILGSLVIVCVSYLAVSAVLTLMWPYYDLKNDGAPLATVFRQVGWPIAQWVVAIGGVFGLMTSLFGTMFPLPRVIYAMATDGLLFRFLGKVHSRYQTPFIGTLLSGLLTGIMAALFHLQQLVDMLSIGTLMAYTLVATCVLLLRYRATDESESCALLNEQRPVKTTAWEVFKQLFNSQGLRSPTNLTSSIVAVLILLYCVFSVVLAFLFVHNERGMIPLGSVACVMTFILILITLQPSTTKSIPFKVPLVPILPALSISMNVYLMLLLDRPTWIRFSVWMVVGCSLWVLYIAWCCCFPEEPPIKDTTYVNAAFDGDLEDTPRENGGVLNHGATPESTVEYVIGDVNTPILLPGPVEEQDTSETAASRVNRFVRPTSVVQGELFMESVSDLTMKGDDQKDTAAKNRGRFVRPTSVHEGRISFEYAAESDVVSIDSDAHSLYPEVLICLPTEEATKQRSVIKEESDTEVPVVETSTDPTEVMLDLSDSTHVQSDDETSDSVTDCLSDFSASSMSERKSLSDRNESSLEAGGQMSVGIAIKPDSDPVKDQSASTYAGLSHTGETVPQQRFTQQSFSAGERLAFNKETETDDSDLESVPAQEKTDLDKTTKSIELGREETIEENNFLNTKGEESETSSTNTIKSQEQDAKTASNSSLAGAETEPRRTRSSLPNFSISSFDNRPIELDSKPQKAKIPGLENAMAAGIFSDSTFVERLNDIIGRNSGSGSSSGFSRGLSIGSTAEVRRDDNSDDDVFISAEAVRSKESIRERLESILSNGSSNLRGGAETRPRTRDDIAKESITGKVGEQVGNLNPENSFIGDLDSIMKRRTGSLPAIKRKDRGEVLSGGHTLPDRRGSKENGLSINSDSTEDVPCKTEIRRRLELLFLKDPKRAVTPVEEISTVL